MSRRAARSRNPWSFSSGSRRRKSRSLAGQLIAAAAKRSEQRRKEQARAGARAVREADRRTRAATRAEATRIRQAERALAALERKKQAEIAKYEAQKQRLQERRWKRESADLDRQIREAQQKAQGARRRGNEREDRAERIYKLLDNGADWSNLSDADKEFILRHAKVRS